MTRFITALLLATATAETASSKSHSVANWWGSFDRYGWSNCDTKDGKYKYIDGLWRNTRGCERLYCIEQAKCSVHINDMNDPQTCYSANWWGSFDRKGWSNCETGYFLSGLMRNSCDQLYCLEQAKCCKSTNSPGNYNNCYNANWWGSFDVQGWSTCSTNHHIAGLYRNNCNELYCIEMAKCCQASSIPQPPPPPAAPPAECPVTCEIDVGQFRGKNVYGYANFHTLDKFSDRAHKNYKNCDKPTNFGKGVSTSTRTGLMNKKGRYQKKDNCDFFNKKANRIVTTHNIEVINEHDSYRKHRCYKYGNKCVCECLDFSDNFQSTRNKGAIANNGIDTVATLQAAGNYWNAPGYIIDHTEVIEIKKCCAKEYAVNPSFILPAHDCTSVGAATSAVIVTALKANIAKGMYDNNAIKKWLHDNGCGKHNKNHKHFGKTKGRASKASLAHDYNVDTHKFTKGDSADTVGSYKVKGIKKKYGLVKN